MVEGELEAGTSFMNARGLLHFDAHFENILTDGRRLFFADYGLAISSGSTCREDEAEFFDRHQTYDRCYTVTYLVFWLITALYGYQRDERTRCCAPAQGHARRDPAVGRSAHHPARPDRRGDDRLLPQVPAEAGRRPTRWRKSASLAGYTARGGRSVRSGGSPG